MNLDSIKGTDDYPYWSNEFFNEFKGLEILYVKEKNYDKEKKQVKVNRYIDSADSYRVFMILCNNNSSKSRMKVLQMLKDATEENPLQINDEIFWTSKI